ncbi:hypothetical protein GC173_16665 [bacterium]|nr:hypothetical protein [bacterium]
MARSQLLLDGRSQWEFDHDLPVLWPWLFDAATITEARRLHSTVFDAGNRFAERRAKASRLPVFRDLLAPFSEVTADRLPRLLDAHPDAVLSLDLAPVESQRPYRHEAASGAWQRFEAACLAANDAAARATWEEAILSPLVIHGQPQRDALALAARAETMGLGRQGQDRATALVLLLFGQPVSRQAKALNHQWAEAALTNPAVAFKQRKPWWRFGG